VHETTVNAPFVFAWRDALRRLRPTVRKSNFSMREEDATLAQSTVLSASNATVGVVAVEIVAMGNAVTCRRGNAANLSASIGVRERAATESQHIQTAIAVKSEHTQ
jgi:hypothetical protein